jgi:hypothetical protein
VVLEPVVKPVPDDPELVELGLLVLLHAAKSPASAQIQVVLIESPPPRKRLAGR